MSGAIFASHYYLTPYIYVFQINFNIDLNAIYRSESTTGNSDSIFKLCSGSRIQVGVLRQAQKSSFDRNIVH